MANLEPIPTFDDVYELKQTDKVDAQGVSNLQAQQLANRTEYLNMQNERLNDKLIEKGANSLERELATATAGAKIAYEDEQTISVDSETQLSFSVVQQSSDLSILEVSTNRLEINKDSTIAIACNLSTIKPYPNEQLELTLTLLNTATSPATPIAIKTLELYPTDENIETHEFNIIAPVSAGMVLELYADLQIDDGVEDPQTEDIGVINFGATITMGAVKIDYATTDKEGVIRIATDNEAKQGIIDDKAIVPSSLSAVLSEELQLINERIQNLSPVDLEIGTTTPQVFLDSTQKQLEWGVIRQSNNEDIAVADDNEVEFKVSGSFLFTNNLHFVRRGDSSAGTLTITLHNATTNTDLGTIVEDITASEDEQFSLQFTTLLRVENPFVLEVYFEFTGDGSLELSKFNSMLASQSISGDALPATTSRKGIIQLATIAEAKVGTDAEKAITPLTLANANHLFVKPKERRGKPLFIKTSPSSIKIPKGFRVAMDGFSANLTDDVIIDLNNDLDTGTKQAGRDYLVYMTQEGNFYFKLDDGSLSSDLLIGGLHYGLTTEDEAKTGNKTDADMVLLRGINAYSMWDLNFRAIGKAGNKGMFFYPSRGKWYDIYLADEDYGLDFYSKPNAFIAAGGTDNGRKYPKIPLIFGGNGSNNYGKLTPFVAMDLANASGKKSISYEEFTGIAYGVEEGLSQAEPVTGKTGHQPQLTSKYGMEQATGVEWIWGADFGSSSSGAWNAHADGRGQVYSGVLVVLLGGSRGNAAGPSGSRCSHWNDGLTYSGWDVGWRGRSDHLCLDKMSESE